MTGKRLPLNSTGTPSAFHLAAPLNWKAPSPSWPAPEPAPTPAPKAAAAPARAPAIEPKAAPAPRATKVPAPASAPTRRGFDPDAVVILKSEPLPEARKPRESAAAILLGRMQVGDCAVLPGPSARALMTFARKRGIVLKMRDMSDKPEHVARFGQDVAGVWMLKAAP